VLARKSQESPKLLGPDDLGAVRDIVGDGAIEYVLVLSAFHFINRIADLLDVDPEALPESLRRFEVLRRLGVRIASRIMRRMDLRNRPYDRTFEQATDAVAPLLRRAGFGEIGALRAAFEPVRAKPWVVEAVEHATSERDERSSLDRGTLERIHAIVEKALPSRAEEATGLHARPRDPVEAFAFVGTRYAYRTTGEMIGSLRAAGHDDLAILDLAIAVADANQWARMHRLLGLAPEIFYLHAGGGAARAATA